MEMPPIDYRLKESKTFCMSPWTHLHGFPNGDFIACCLSPGDKVVGNLNDQSLEEIWNSEDIRRLRRNMIADKPTPDICHRCYTKEKHGFTSLRTGMNERYGEKYDGLVQSTKEDGTVDDVNIVHWDFRFSNICNLRCRTCGPGFSSNWFDDFYKLEEMTPEAAAEHKKANPRLQRMVNDPEKFWAIMDPLVDTVESIHFAGGEPLIMDEHYRILSRMIEKKRFDPYIRYSTNFSKLRYKNFDVLSMWSNFQNIELILSLDGMGPQFNFLRKGGDWAEVEKNMADLKLMNMDQRIRWGLHPTISVFNIFHIPKFHRYLLETKFIEPGKFYSKEHHYYCDFILNNLIHPEYYSVEIMPLHLKEQAAAAIEEHATWAHENYGVPKNGWGGLVDFMMRTDNSHMIPKFKQMTLKLDGIRGEDCPSLFPELGELFQ